MQDSLYLSKKTCLFFSLQVTSNTRRGKPYDKANLLRAYEATQSGMSVYRASCVYSVPESTLRDRTRCNVALDATPGPSTLLSWEEEKHLVDHIKYMGDIGYGYTKSEVQYMATDYCQSLRKSVKSENGLSSFWFYAFLKRWPDIKIVKPQKLQMYRAKSASKETIDKYFRELGQVLRQNNLMEAPERIYNIDETGISMEHAPPKIVCSSTTNPQAITSPRQSNVTIIAGANAIGNSIPPFYVIPGKRWCDDFLDGAPAGSAGKMSSTGWSNMSVFEYYVTEHLAKHAKIAQNNAQSILVMYDDHKSHLSLTLTEWARQRNVILFVLPPHTSHLTQPLDVGVFGPFKSQYNKECQGYLQKNPGVAITKYEVAKLTAKPYLKAVCPENVVSAFRKSGIYPYNSNTILPSQLAPSIIYETETIPETGSAIIPDTETETIPNTNSIDPEVQEEPESAIETQPPPAEVESPEPAMLCEASKDNSEIMQNFFNERKITKVVSKPKKKFVTPYKVTGSLMKKSNIESLTIQASKREAKQLPTSKPKAAVNSKAKKQSVPKSKVSKPTSFIKTEPIDNLLAENSVRPGTSGLNRKGAPIDLTTPDASENESDIVDDDGEKCCVCDKYEPVELVNHDEVYFVKWGECDSCGHWTHLRFCCPTRVLRRGDVFRCPHCLLQN